MKKNSPVNYCRRGWKDRVLYVADHDDKAGTVDLANAEGEVKVIACRYIADPSKETALPEGYATKAAPDEKPRTEKPADPVKVPE